MQCGIFDNKLECSNFRFSGDKSCIGCPHIGIKETKVKGDIQQKIDQLATRKEFKRLELIAIELNIEKLENLLNSYE